MKNGALPVLLCMIAMLDPVFAQNVQLEGYAYESDNRGYLNEVKVSISPKDEPDKSMEIFSDVEGFFQVFLPAGKTFVLRAEKPLFHAVTQDVSTYGLKEGEKVFAKVALHRRPGYLFDVTLAEEKVHRDSSALAIEGALIEIYNNSKEVEALVLRDYPHPNFSFTFQQGNHYTVLIRKHGYFSKRLEARVNVEGCILCFEGLASIESVTDNLTQGHEMGSILANIELKRAFLGSLFKIENIFYDLDQSYIRQDAAAELDKLAIVLKDNPTILVELGSHTDSRGLEKYNQELSQRRADEAVKYLISQGVSVDQIKARGYGESVIVNDCHSGVPCSDEAHQENRRTEIRVIGLDSDTPLITKSLVDIKREEKFIEMLDDLTSEEQIMVSSEDELPEEIKAQVFKQKTKGQEDVLTEYDKPEKTESENDMWQSRSELVDTLGVTPAPDENVDGASPNVVLENTHTIDPGYTGVKIQILALENAKDLRAEAVAGFDRVYYEVDVHGVCKYLIGHFKDINEALIYFEEHMKAEWPNARIIEFVKGKRL